MSPTCAWVHALTTFAKVRSKKVTYPVEHLQLPKQKTLAGNVQRELENVLTRLRNQP
jgi:hypothetical protein